MALKFEVPGSSGLGDILQTYNFVTVKSAAGSDGMNAVYSRSAVVDDFVSGEDVETFGARFVYICGLLASVVFVKIEISHLCKA